VDVEAKMIGTDAAEFVPHSGRMVLLHRVVGHDEESTTCSVEIRPDSTFVSNGQVGPWVGLEYMAQTIAAHGGLAAVQEDRPVRIGFFLGCRSVDLSAGPFRVGQILHVHARRLWGDEHLMKFSCSITDAATGALLQEADLSVYDPGEEFDIQDFEGGMGS
jgi:predicted hotdog family 3-hydroxylacyl-ACP dehydratase